MNRLNEYRSRREWLKEARRQVEAGEVSLNVIGHTLQRFMRNPIRSVVSYCDVDSESGYSDTGNYEAEVKREYKGYLADIAALESAIAKQRRDKALMDATNNISNKIDEHTDRITNKIDEHTDYDVLLRTHLQSTASQQDRQQDQPKEKAKGGRDLADFRDRIVCDNETDKEVMLDKIGRLANGKKGRKLVLVMVAAMEANIISGKPSFGELQKVFSVEGTYQGYDNYWRRWEAYGESKKGFSKSEIDRVIRLLSED